MLDRTQRAPSALDLAAQAVEDWLDGAGSAFATRLGKDGGGRRARTWLLAVDHPVLDGKPVSLIVPRDFPANPVQIRVNKKLCLVLPHVEEDGRVCLGMEAWPVDYAHPVHAVDRALEIFEGFLERCRDPSWIEKELHRERLAYWGRWCLRRRRAHDRRPAPKQTFISHQGAVVTGRGLAAVYENGNAILTFGEQDPNILARRHRLAGGTMTLGDVLLIGAELAWTPATWPRDFAQLDALIGQATEHQTSLQAWLQECEDATMPAHRRQKGISTKADRPSKSIRRKFVVLAQKGIYYGFQLSGPLAPSAPAVEPLFLDRIDPTWALTRDHLAPVFGERRKKKVLVLGCGSLASPLLELLVRAGVAHVHVVDAQAFQAENCSRHVLGMSALGKNKAVAMAERLNLEIPGARVYGVAALAVPWIDQVCSPGDYDLVIEATGESSVRTAISQLKTRSLGAIPVIYAWMEPYCAAAHAVLECANDSWPSHDPADELVNAAGWPEQTRIELPACSAGFHPYGAADAFFAASFVAERVIAALDGLINESMVWSWVRTKTFFESLPVKAHTRHIVPSRGGHFDSTTLTRSLDEVLRESK
ncbi:MULTISPECIES: ThiF family adenylyltransferase [unclassified Variovorax]|uniref:ThiF family adenylyltransferase n=1 Tax=unclassified Variovorax TaxID=663243 RepID=UPI0008CB3E2D|nr:MULTISPECIES: ThiF family adenylyltransferase [unclassified Variovorax]SEK13044.1 ThiF family protein [Variovorax sp. OK202]SFD87924.1 ThiF family protein [Variovorax sp. OK212]